MEIPTLIPVWRASLERAGLSPRTTESYAATLRVFAATLAPPIVDHLSPQTIARFHSRRLGEVHPRTANFDLSAIRSFCRFLVDAELRPDNPATRVGFTRIGDELPERALDPSQIRALFAALGTPPDGMKRNAAYHWRRSRLTVTMLYYTGLRLAEAAALRWEAVSRDRAVLTVRGGKGKKDRAVPIHPRLLAVLAIEAEERRRKQTHVIAQQDGHALTPKSLAHVFERWIPDHLDLDFPLTAHQLRHTFCTDLINHGAKLEDVQALMGHADPRTTLRYYRMQPEHLRGAIGLLPTHV